MEEILASIRRIIEDGNPPKADEVGQADGEDTALQRDVAAFSREFAGADVFTPPVAEAVVQTMEARQEPSFIDMPVVDNNLIDNELIEGSIAAPESPAISNVPQPFHELRPIISQAAGRKVAKSFEHLQVALNEERNTSVASMTEEMLRPLLQDWLDNNLPTLVERLVREEIERVARGPR
jgi:cell pole-organizing protein PopZ